MVTPLLSPMKTLHLILLSVLWKGFLCQIYPDYAVTANESVTVQEGLCVLIQCTFTFSAEQTLGDKPNGFWFREGTSSTRDKPVATNDASRPVSEDTRGRFKLVGNISNRDCTLRIDDAKKKDRGTYFLRIEGGYSFNYKYTTQPFVNVTDLWEQPELSCSAELVVGTPVSITCTAPGRCAGTAPTITWAGTLNTANSTVNTSSVIGNETDHHASTITFTPTLRDQNKTLTCAVDYPAVGASTQNTLTLHLRYRLKSRDQLESTCSELHEGMSCSCFIHSDPPPVLSWLLNEEMVSGNYSSRTLQVLTDSYGHTAKSTLTLREMKDNTVDIQCLNANRRDILQKACSELWDSGIIAGVVCGTIIIVSLTALTAFYCGRKIGATGKGNGAQRQQSKDTKMESPYQELSGQTNIYDDLQKTSK